MSKRRLWSESKDSLVERTALRGYIIFLNEVVDKDARHVIFVVQINWWLECVQGEKHVYGFCISDQGHQS